MADDTKNVATTDHFPRLFALGLEAMPSNSSSLLTACGAALHLLLAFGCGEDPSANTGTGAAATTDASGVTSASDEGVSTRGTTGVDSGASSGFESSGTTDMETAAATSSSSSTGEEKPDRPNVVAPVSADWVSVIAGAERTPTVRRRPGGAAVVAVGSGTMEFGYQSDAPIPVELNIPSTALGLLDGDSGAIDDVVRLAFGPPATSFIVPAMERMPGGDLLLAGGWIGSTTLLPDSASPVEITAQSIGEAVAYDPIFLRLTPEAELVWWMRGRTTALADAPVLQTGPGFSIEPLSGGDIAIVGRHYTSHGLVLGDGTEGATTLSAATGSYFARLDAEDGSPVWVRENDGAPWGHFPHSAQGLGDGSVLLPLIFSIVRVTSSGELTWTIGLYPEERGFTAGFAALPNGEVVVVGESKLGGLDVVSADGSVHAHRQPGSWIARFDNSGVLRWIQSTTLSFDHFLDVKTGIRRDAEFTPLVDGDSIWLAGAVEWPYEVVVGDERVALPELGLSEDETMSVVQRYEADGTPAEVRVVGANLFHHVSIDWADPDHQRIYAASNYRCAGLPRRVIGDSFPELDPLPSDCEHPRYAFVAAFPLGSPSVVE